MGERFFFAILGRGEAGFRGESVFCLQFLVKDEAVFGAERAEGVSSLLAFSAQAANSRAGGGL